MSCASPKPIRGHQPASRGARFRQEEAGARVGVAFVGHGKGDAQGRRAFSGGIAGGRMGGREACVAVELFYGRITTDVKKGLQK
jgi:hypothetical protein